VSGVASGARASRVETFQDDIQAILRPPACGREKGASEIGYSVKMCVGVQAVTTSAAAPGDLARAWISKLADRCGGYPALARVGGFNAGWSIA
jgi:hypothetical protein